jgi:hypothetical protein
MRWDMSLPAEELPIGTPMNKILDISKSFLDLRP